MAQAFHRLSRHDNLHGRVTRALALRVIESRCESERTAFPNEAELCQQLGVSRSIVREAVKVLADKGMVEVRPRVGTRPRPREQWHLLDADILTWETEGRLDAGLLRELCEVRLAIEPTASGFAALRATDEDLTRIEQCLRQRESMKGATDPEQASDLDVGFHEAVIAASHNLLLKQLSAMIRQPLRSALSHTVRRHASESLAQEGHRALFDALKARDPMAARTASERIVGLAMLAVEQVIQLNEAAP